jgi:starch-binding outer membrane protein, SusD/RagB family
LRIHTDTSQSMTNRTKHSTLATVALLFSFAACSTSDMLEVQTPDQITPDKAASAVGAAALRASAIGNFAAFYGGDYGGSFHGVNITSGMLTDEIESARGGTEHLDSRAQNEAVQPLNTTWAFVGQSTTQTIRAIKALREFALEGTATERATKATQLGHLYALQGFAYIILAENYCSGIPVANADDLAPKTDILTTAQMFARATAYLDTAAATLGSTAADVPFRNLVAVGKGRIQTDLARYAEAATTVASVPTSFVFNISYSATSVVNAIYDWMNGTLNYAPADKEGGNGMDYISARDPRVTVIRNAAGAPTPRAGQDGALHFTQTVFPLANSPVPLATGVEARLIQAEAALQAGSISEYLGRMNEARATVPALSPLTDPGTAQARENLLFRERAFWFWGTAHRLGDLRRLVKDYKRAATAVYPDGPYFKGGAYGPDVVLIPAQAERNNPDYKGCVSTTP